MLVGTTTQNRRLMFWHLMKDNQKWLFHCWWHCRFLGDSVDFQCHSLFWCQAALISTTTQIMRLLMQIWHYQPLVCRPCGSQWRMRGQKLFQAHSWPPQADHVHKCHSSWAPGVCPIYSWIGELHFLCSSLKNPSSSFSYAWTVTCKTEPQRNFSCAIK